MFIDTAQKPSRALHMDLGDLDPIIILDTTLSGIKETTFASPQLGYPFVKQIMIFASFIKYSELLTEK